VQPVDAIENPMISVGNGSKWVTDQFQMFYM
jgi:hypothetical protein